MGLLLQGSTIGIYFINRPEWMIVDHACSAYSYISVPLYDTLGLLMFEQVLLFDLCLCPYKLMSIIVSLQVLMLSSIL